MERRRVLGRYLTKEVGIQSIGEKILGTEREYDDEAEGKHDSLHATRTHNRTPFGIRPIPLTESCCFFALNLYLSLTIAVANR